MQQLAQNAKSIKFLTTELENQVKETKSYAIKASKNVKYLQKV